MYFSFNIGLSGYRDFDEIIQAHDRVYSDDPKIAQLGCEQIFSWLAKNFKNPFFEITAIIRSNLLQDSRNLLTNSKLNQFYISIKRFCSRTISEFPSNNKYYKTYLQYSCNDEYKSPPKDELLEFANYLFTYLDENFWIPKIKIHQQCVENALESISKYFEDEKSFDLSKSNFLLYFTPILAKFFCKDWKDKVDESELIFGFTRSQLIKKIPKFIANAKTYTDDFFADSFAFEFSDYLIIGSVWASQVLDLLFENDICDIKIISNYILCAPQQNETIINFLKKHNVNNDEQAGSFWYGTPMGMTPYEYCSNIDSNSLLEVDNHLVGFLSESRDYNSNNKKRFQNKYIRKDSSSSNSDNKSPNNNNNGNDNSNNNNGKSNLTNTKSSHNNDNTNEQTKPNSNVAKNQDEVSKVQTQVKPPAPKIEKPTKKLLVVTKDKK